MTWRGMFASQQLRQLHSLWFCTAVFPQCIELYFCNAELYFCNTLNCISAMPWIVFLQCIELCFCNALNCIYAMHCCISTCTELYFWNTLNCISAMNWIVFLKHTELYFSNALTCWHAHCDANGWSGASPFLLFSSFLFFLNQYLFGSLVLFVVLFPSTFFISFLNQYIVLFCPFFNQYLFGRSFQFPEEFMWTVINFVGVHIWHVGAPALGS